MMQEWQMITAGHQSCSLYMVLNLNNLSIHVTSSQKALPPLSKEKLNEECPGVGSEHSS